MMCLAVAGVSTLIHLYSTAYMGGDRGYSRFFAYLNFFVFSMLLLVLAANFFILIVGWAFVGAASYMLISFWYRRTTATTAGIKAFVINVLGDVGLVLGTFFMFRGTHTLDFLQDVRASSTRPSPSTSRSWSPAASCCWSARSPSRPRSRCTPGCPDAMEGPTPVSALIHAATMVTAGVYLIARLHPIFERAPDAAAVGAIVGCVTLLIAATIAPRGDRSQAGHRLLDDVADRLHDHGRVLGRLRRGHVPPDDARVLQGAALHGRRLGDLGDGRQPEPRPDGRLPQGDAVHLRLHARSAASRCPASRRSAASGPRTRSSRSSSTVPAGTTSSAWRATSARS